MSARWGEALLVIGQESSHFIDELRPGRVTGRKNMISHYRARRTLRRGLMPRATGPAQTERVCRADSER